MLQELYTTDYISPKIESNVSTKTNNTKSIYTGAPKPVKSLIRDFAKGKSFEFTVWEPAVKYQNNDIQQDFVSYENTILACKKDHVSLDPPEFLYDQSGNIIGIDSENWILVLTNTIIETRENHATDFDIDSLFK